MADTITREANGIMPSSSELVAAREAAFADERRDLDATEQSRPFALDAAHLARQREFSERTFGPGPRREGVIDHITKELAEARENPREFVDIIILAFDGLWRAGIEPQDALDMIAAKQARNEARDWPDWREQPTDRAIEHVRVDGEADFDTTPTPTGEPGFPPRTDAAPLAPRG